MLVAGGLEVSALFFGLLGFLCLAAGLVASLSGTGGGSLFIPIFSLAFPTDLHRAVPLAKVAVFGVALGASLVNLSNIRSDSQDSSFIHYELATLIQPATLIGCLIGVFLNLLLPSVAITLCLIAILSFTAYKTFSAARLQEEESIKRKLCAEEGRTPSTALEDFEPIGISESHALLHNLQDSKAEVSTVIVQMQHMRNAYSPRAETPSHHHSADRSPMGHQFVYGALQAASDQMLLPFSSLEYSQNSCFEVSTPASAGGSLSAQEDPTKSESTPLIEPWNYSSENVHCNEHLSSISFSGRKSFSSIAVYSNVGRSREIALLGAVWIINATGLAFAGGPAALACGPGKKRLCLYGLITFHLVFMILTAHRLKKKKQLLNAQSIHTHYWWVEDLKMIKYCALSCLAGAAAGLLGIGGGLVKGPLLISIGLLPINAVATSNYMILFTSSTNVLAFLFAGRLDWKHSLVFAMLTSIGGISGATTLRRKFGQSQRQHLLTYVLGCSIVLGGCAMAVVNLRELYFRMHGQAVNVHEKTYAEACEYLMRERSPWQVNL